MGHAVNPLYLDYVRLSSELPDPIYGFFLIDTCYMPGVMGLSYSHWKTASCTNLLRLSPKAVTANELFVSAEGGVLRTLTIKMGESKKWKAMVERLAGGRDVQQEIESNPELLFRKAETIEELELKLIIKATMPSVAQSMMGGNAFCQALASSVYSINTHCYSKVNMILNVTKNEKVYEKVSLLQEMTKAIGSIREGDLATEEEWRMMFPAMDRYVEADLAIQELQCYHLVACKRMRNKRNHLMIQPHNQLIPISLKQILKELWFGTNLAHTRMAIQRCRDYYLSRLSWIKPTISETLEASPFLTYQEMAGFIESYDVKSRHFMRFGPVANHPNFKRCLIQLMSKSYKDKYVFQKLIRLSGPSSNDFLTNISLAVAIPLPEKREEIIYSLFDKQPIFGDSPGQLANLSFPEKKLALIQMVMKGYNMSDILALVKEVGTGMLVSYPMPQRRDTSSGTTRWLGRGQALVRALGIIIRIDMRDDLCTRIHVSKWNVLRKHPKTLNAILKNLSLSPLNTSTYSPGAISRFSQKGFTSPGGRGTPIVEDANLVAMDCEDCSLEVEIRHMSIRIMQTFKKSEDLRTSRVVVLKWAYNENYVHPQPNTTVYKDIWEAWMNQGVLESTTLAKKLADLSKARLRSDPLAQWLMYGLHARLVRRVGLNSRLKTSEYEDVITVIEEEATAISESDLTALTAQYEDLLNVSNFDAQLKMFENSLFMGMTFTQADFDYMEDEVQEDISIESKTLCPYAATCAFYDGLIDLGLDGVPSFWNRLFAGIPPSSAGNFADHIMYLYGIKKLSKVSKFDFIEPLHESPVVDSNILEDRLLEQESDSDDDDNDIDMAALLEIEGGMTTVLKTGSYDYNIDHERITEILSLSNLPGFHDEIIRVIGQLRVTNPYVPTTCTAELWAVPVTHDGNCWFYSFQRGVNYDISIGEVKERLYQSPFLIYSQEPNVTRQILSSAYEQADADIMLLASREFNIGFCIHAVDKNGLKTCFKICHSENQTMMHLKWWDYDTNTTAKYELLRGGRLIPRQPSLRPDWCITELENHLSYCTLSNEVRDSLLEIVNSVRLTMHERNKINKEMEVISARVHSAPGMVSCRLLPLIRSYDEVKANWNDLLHESEALVSKISSICKITYNMLRVLPET